MNKAITHSVLKQFNVFVVMTNVINMYTILTNFVGFYNWQYKKNNNFYYYFACFEHFLYFNEK